MSENAKQEPSMGEIAAVIPKVAGQYSLFGLVWTAKQVTRGAKATGKVFADEWKRQKESK